MKRVLLISILVFSISIEIFSLEIYKDIIQPGEKLVGVSYKAGGVTPSGFDCSGFVVYLYRKYVPGLPRVSRSMAEFGEPVARDSILPGDLVFFATGSSPGRITHVAIYIGQNSIIHSISDGPNRGVTITSLDARYWQKRYFSAVRIVDTEVVPGKSASGSETDVVSGRTRVEKIRFSRGVYSGEVLAGEPDGQGILLMNNGDKYEGLFADGTFEGEGTYTWADGRSYTGIFHDGRSSDTGVLKENYMFKKDSPWETWDGIVEGDFNLYLQQDQDAFEEWKKNN